MIQTKTLSLPLIAALFGSVVAPADAQVRMELSTRKTYRQDPASLKFKGGTFDNRISDGGGVKVGGCDRAAYYPPTNILFVCSGGSTALLTSGSFGGATIANPYLWVTGITPAIILEPRRPELGFLRSAPASLLPRPEGGFSDDSFSLFFNLHTTDVREFVITRYITSRGYDATERTRFEKEVVPGIYYYSFPRLKLPNLTVPIAAVIRPMPEGIAKINNRATGFQFNTTGQTWDANGFLELSVNRPSVIKWSGFSPSVVLPGVDRLYFSLRYLSDPADANSEARYTNPTDKNPLTRDLPASFFPGFVNGGDPRVLLVNPFVTSFTLPPIFPAGTRVVAQLDLQRTFQTGGVTFDLSSRKFEIPVTFTDRYLEFALARFGRATAKVGILQDFDGDGFNNLTEWILNSSPANALSKPVPPVAALTLAVTDGLFPPTIITPASFGFTVTKKQNTVPAVIYSLERSTDGGVTYLPMVTDANWTVTNDATTVSIASKITNGVLPTPTPIQPPGTEAHRYRLVITLAP